MQQDVCEEKDSRRTYMKKHLILHSKSCTRYVYCVFLLDFFLGKRKGSSPWMNVSNSTSSFDRIGKPQKVPWGYYRNKM